MRIGVAIDENGMARTVFPVDGDGVEFERPQGIRRKRPFGWDKKVMY
ncbi:MAG: hypothetical protein LBI99_02640 [Propionibacteriaceae bacterium]|nr:hypothetical protein [Propionibacteriaceae bacterium]